MLELKNINAGYGTFQALFDVSLSIKAGEAIAVIGPNGAGKTTLLRVMSRLLEASAGDMVMEGPPTATCPRMRWWAWGLHKCPRGVACSRA